MKALKYVTEPEKTGHKIYVYLHYGAYLFICMLAIHEFLRILCKFVTVNNAMYAATMRYCILKIKSLAKSNFTYSR